MRCCVKETTQWKQLFHAVSYGLFPFGSRGNRQKSAAVVYGGEDIILIDCGLGFPCFDVLAGYDVPHGKLPPSPGNLSNARP